MKCASCAGVGCPADCPGHRSPWHAALGEQHPCPLGIPFCGSWNPDEIIRKVRRNSVERKEIAA